MAIATVNGIRMHYRQAGDGPLLVLLHGWPQTGHCWRHLVAPLAEAYTVVVPDLRGYGRSDLPRDGHDKRTRAEDLHRLIRVLGHESATVIGHDRGARVAHRWALDHPGDIERLVLMDIIPTREMWRRMDAGLARRTWHWLFHLQPDLPELLAGANPGAYVRYLIDAWAHVPLPEEDIAEYVRAFSRPGALRAGFDDYRAADEDAAHDEADAGRRIPMPLLALWGEHSFLQTIDTVAVWRDYAEDVTGTMIEDCGHFLAEERPEAVLAELRGFLPRLKAAHGA
ncbi:alpha/beta fold hydrolase [Actinoallomurus rhizosphaericola]|uniref:alpha/beta fold hydrolase n=1 Tax=Actinoallomurus rhizosphaericola TaxID=2952536 RepID=UPI0020903F8C|nr:alpha/beta hydrolase [Actinoallomurus rhizosphaericola]MCO5993083.1 alpha/beta hydrolase [Actinoallomurus rhizosphaericola]